MPTRVITLAVLLLAARAWGGTLVINANTADPAPRAAWESVVGKFRSERPDIAVQFNVYDSESYKRSIRNWLTAAPPDVVFWYAGNRMRQFVAPGLLEDVSDLYEPDVRAAMHPSAVELVSVSQRQYGVPYTYYQVGLYLRRDLLSAVGAPVPERWQDLLVACERLKARGIEPIAIGTRDLWPAAAWFDYIDLRTHGLARHMDLVQGRVPWTDPRVRAVFARWRELIDRDCFSRSHASSSWQESQALLYEGRAAMMLIGNFIVANFPPAVREQIDLVAFPTIETGLGRFEDAPMNTLHIPARARNKDEARAFLRFVLRPEVQEQLNRATLQIPVNERARGADDRFLVRSRQLLESADGLAQYFDRDTSEEVANVAMKGFQEFMLYPDRLDVILGGIEKARLRVYGAIASPASR